MFRSGDRFFFSKKEAISHAYDLACQNIREEFKVYECFGGRDPVHVAKVWYAEDDDVWEAKVSHEDCVRIWTSALIMAADDVTGNASLPMNAQEKMVHDAFVESRDYRGLADVSSVPADAADRLFSSKG